jgi:hypothetical protein
MAAMVEARRVIDGAATERAWRARNWESASVGVPGRAAEGLLAPVHPAVAPPEMDDMAPTAAWIAPAVWQVTETTTEPPVGIVTV